MCSSDLHQLSDEAAAALGRALARVARAVLTATGAEHYNVLQNNGESAHQAVPHVHFHIIPRLGDQGLGIEWNSGTLEDNEGLLQRMHSALAQNEGSSQ